MFLCITPYLKNSALRSAGKMENTLFCSEACRKRANLLGENEKRRKRAEEPINRILRKKEDHNRRHGTKYSYGQYVALGEKKDV